MTLHASCLCRVCLVLLVLMTTVVSEAQQKTPLFPMLPSKELMKQERAMLAEMTGPALSFEVHHKVRLDEIPVGTKEVLIWISMPADSPHQQMLTMENTTLPGDWSIVQDEERRGTFMYSRITNPSEASLEFEFACTFRRSPVFVEIVPEQVRPLTDLERSCYAEHLNRNALHMEVTDKIQTIADTVCGAETNIARQMLLIMNHLAASVDHYSYSGDPDMPRCGVGDAANCLAQGGGCCTDLNSLMIALSRARGIPARLNMGFRLPKASEGHWVDSGYRCWVEYFVPGFGWVSADIVEADSPGGPGQVRWLTGLSARRVCLNQGRQFRLTGATAAEFVNHMTVAYAEIDGVPARPLPEGDQPAQITRKILFTELPSDSTVRPNTDVTVEKAESTVSATVPDSGSLPSDNSEIRGN